MSSLSIDEIIGKQTEWHSKANQGCIFATYLIKKNPPEAKLKRVCFDEELSEDLIRKISKIATDGINDKDTYALSILLPKIRTIQDLFTFIKYCKQYSNWTIQDNDIYDKYRLVRIRIPFEEKTQDGQIIYAWVIGFSPFDFLPPTRQSPYFEIMFATKSKSFFKEQFGKFSLTQHHSNTIDRGGENVDAHLADLFMDGITNNEEKDSHLWTQSSNRKWQLLNKAGLNNDTNAKAKVSFSYPLIYES